MKHKLLLVEDEEHLAFTLEFNLTQEGYEVVVATSLEQATAAMAAADFSLLLLDVMLPDGDGFSFCRALRADEILTPVLFLTAKGTPDDIVEGLEAGGDDYITKPFVLKELLARLSAILRRKQWLHEGAVDEGSESGDGFIVPDTYRFGRASVHFVSHTAEVAGEEVNLTALEFRLLGFFVAHENQAISREELLERVWEVGRGNATRTVDNFIVRLRRVFEQDPSKPKHFLTVRGVGYRFIGDEP